MAFHVHRSSPFRVDVVHGMGQIAPQIFSTSAKVYIETANLDGETNLKTKMAGGVLRVHEVHEGARFASRWVQVGPEIP